MKFKFPAHFQDRIQGRKINIDDVKKAISKPDKKEIVFQGRVRVSKKIGGKIIEVVYFKSKPTEYIIITAYYLQ